jgi:hypothetical protein
MVNVQIAYIFAPPIWEISSAGSEHLVYTEGVGGSNPSSPTKAAGDCGFFILAV